MLVAGTNGGQLRPWPAAGVERFGLGLGLGGRRGQADGKRLQAAAAGLLESQVIQPVGATPGLAVHQLIRRIGDGGAGQLAVDLLRSTVSQLQALLQQRLRAVFRLLRKKLLGLAQKYLQVAVRLRLLQLCHGHEQCGPFHRQRWQPGVLEKTGCRAGGDRQVQRNKRRT